MATTLVLRLPWGRFHATPWDRNVNEGVVDWPPSPWRILRGLYATWQTRAPHLGEGAVLGALSRLTDAPTYLLPPYRSGHTRHYLPDLAHRSGKPGNTDKILDAFVVTEREAEIGVTWPVDLSADERSALAELADALPYVGRADTICLARLADSEMSGEVVSPLATGASAPPGAAIARVLAPTSPLSVEQLTARSADIRQQKLARPAGTRWVEYALPPELGTQPPSTLRPAARPTAVRWVVAGRARPSVHATVAVTHVLRDACQSRFGQLFSGAASPQLSGKEPSGVPLKGHVHAHYLALDQPARGAARGDRRIEHLLVWVGATAGGLEDDVLAALGTVHLKGLRGHQHLSDFRPLRLGLEAIGAIGDVAPELVAGRDAGRVWESHSAFVPPRHRKRGQDAEDFLTAELTRELSSRGLPAPRTVIPVRGDWLAYRRHRRAMTEARWATGARLTFDEPVAGPLSLGALSHFGLGLFLPVE